MSARKLLLEVQDLHVRYGLVEALSGVSIRLGEGEIVSIIGANGAGKTTLMGAIMGLLPVASGQVRYAGRDIATLGIEQRVTARMSLVPESRELWGAMSVEDNLLLGAFARHRQGERDEKANLAEVYDLFPRLRERRSQYAGTLSGGERQMLALGRALMGKPQLLMLDEPSLGLAPKIVREIFHIVSRLRETGVSILLVEQNARAALQISDFGYVLETGSVALEGPAAELSTNPRLIESYLGLSRAS